MKLYYAKGACSLAVRIVINELNLPCEYEAVNLKTKLTAKGEDFYKVNTKGAVPTLVLDNGEVLTENAVIQQYLADTSKNGTSLLPKVGEMQRYRALEWLNYVSSELHKGCGPFFNPDMPEEAKTKVFQPLLNKKLDYVEKMLADSDYLLGKDMCLADVYLFVVLSWLPHIGFKRAQWKSLERFYQNMAKRPAVQKSLTDEKLI